MSLFSLLLIAVSLAMDAFAVSAIGGATIQPLDRRTCFRLSFHFGLFQFLMPVIGWFAGTQFVDYIARWDHWFAFGLLSLIGAKMIYESFQGIDQSVRDISRGWTLVSLSIATSIDALAIGLTLALLNVHILLPSIFIGIVAALFSLLGIALGRRFGIKFGPKIYLPGGLILIFLGIHILLSHLGG
jgi:manganese efflux pump family protein